MDNRVVEEEFITTGWIWNLQVNGRTIRTTAEHPFYVWNQNWRAAYLLKVGDRLRSNDGQTVTVEAVCDSGTIETVYNCRVAEYHTYFVGGTVAKPTVFFGKKAAIAELANTNTNAIPTFVAHVP